MVEDQERKIEDRINELEDKMAKVDELLGVVFSFVREHSHDSSGNSYVPQRL